MFKPTHFRFQNSIQWPGAGPTTEIAADNIRKVETENDHFTFVHAGGHAVKVPKAEVTAYGVYDADDVPNLPTPEDYKDDITKLSDEGDADDSVDEGSQFGEDDSSEEVDKPAEIGELGSDTDIDAEGESGSFAHDDTETDTDAADTSPSFEQDPTQSSSVVNDSGDDANDFDGEPDYSSSSDVDGSPINTPFAALSALGDKESEIGSDVDSDVDTASSSKKSKSKKRSFK